MNFERSWLDLPDAQFEQKVQPWLQDLKGITTLASTRKAKVQKAIDLTWGWAIFTDGEPYYARNSKWNTLHRQHMTIFKEPAPKHSVTIRDKIAKREVLIAQRNLIQERVKLIEHWIATKNSDPDAFFQGPEDVVQNTLQGMYDDAKKRRQSNTKEPWMTVWTGAEGTKTGAWTKERTKLAVEGEVSFKAGVHLEGQFTYEFHALKIKGSTEAFAGARGKASASASASLADGISASVSGEVMIGVSVSAAISMELGDNIEAGASAKAFAGAMASGSAKFSLNSEGLALSLKGEAFAGFKAEGEGHVVMKWKGREIFKSESTVAFTAGIGVTGELTFEAGLGSNKVAVKGGLTIGVGSEVGTKVEYSLMNLELAGSQWLYEELWQFATPASERYELMMMDQANVTFGQLTVTKLKEIEAGVNRDLKTVEAMIAI